jgi:hypothetical protein
LFSLDVMARTAAPSFVHQTLWLIVSAVIAWLFLCLSYVAYTVMTSPVDYWRFALHPWSGVRDTLNVLLRIYIPAFVLLAIPACYSGRLPKSLCKRAVIGGLLFACVGMLSGLYFKGILAAILSRPATIEFAMWLCGLVLRPLIFCAVFLFIPGAVAFSLLPPRDAERKTSNESLQSTVGGSALSR